jgi:putative transposase
MASPALLRGRDSRIGAWYVVTSVCHGRLPRFEDARCASLVVDELRQSDARGLTGSMAWVVMPDHLHWLFRLKSASLSYAIHSLKSRSAHRITRTGGYRGPVWQAGYFDHQVRDPDALRRHVRYLLDNPRRRGLVERFEDYPFAWCRVAVGTADLL